LALALGFLCPGPGIVKDRKVDISEEGQKAGVDDQVTGTVCNILFRPGRHNN
jgi:hypothetical protein